MLATASDGDTQTETFTITVRDVNEYDVSPISTVGSVADEISEHAEGGSQTGIQVSASDRDVSDTRQLFHRRSALSKSTTRAIVSIAEDATFDAETEGSVSFTVTATSTDGSTSEQTFTLRLSDENEYAVSACTDSDSARTTPLRKTQRSGHGGRRSPRLRLILTRRIPSATPSTTARFTVDENGVVTVADGASV